VGSPKSLEPQTLNRLIIGTIYQLPRELRQFFRINQPKNTTKGIKKRRQGSKPCRRSHLKRKTTQARKAFKTPKIMVKVVGLFSVILLSASAYGGKEPDKSTVEARPNCIPNHSLKLKLLSLNKLIVLAWMFL
jgi:hypothetical protein